MKIFHQTLALLILLSVTECNAQPTGKHKEQVTHLEGHTSTLSSTQVKGANRMYIKSQFNADCYGYSSAKNAIPSNGEAHSDNLASPIDTTFPRNGLYMVINEKEYLIRDKYLHRKLYLVNTADTATKLEAQDSRLNIIAEALNEKSEWKPISYLSWGGCGNSYHTVVLNTNEYWQFDVPVFTGSMKTKMRYVLLLNNEQTIVSNEILAYLNPGQFNRADYMLNGINGPTN